MTDNNTKNPELNAQRRERYETDAEYAEHIRTSRRERYRRMKGKNIRHCDVTASDVIGAGSKREMAEGGEQVTLSTKELAELMGYHYLTVVRWQNAGFFPRPNQPTKTRPDICMYHPTQARKLANVMAKHQETHQGLYKKDTTTISRLFAAMN